MAAENSDQSLLMREILEAIKTLQSNQTHLAANVDAITGRVNILAGIKEVQDAASSDKPSESSQVQDHITNSHALNNHVDNSELRIPESPTINPTDPSQESRKSAISISQSRKNSVTSRIILT
jgi:hypothetical protein